MIWRIALLILFLEAFRKYFFNTVYIFAIIDVVFIFLILKFTENNKNLIKFLSIILLVTIILSLYNGIFHKEYPVYIFAQFREFLPFIAGWAIGISKNFKPTLKELNILCIILAVVTMFAVLQIYSTPEGFLNFIPANQAIGSSRGFGGYAKEIEDLYGGNLFRPSLVFMVTGKYGTFVAALTIYITSLLLIFNIKGFRFYTYISVLLIANAVAMQRAFFYPYIFFLVIFLIYNFYINKKRLYFMLIVSLLIPISFLINVKPIFDRLLIFPKEIIQRIIDLGLLKGLLSSDIIYIGRGPGYFSNYSQVLGGGFFSDYFGGEGAWHILIANYGLILPLFLLIWIIVKNLNILKYIKYFKNINILLFYYFNVLLLIVWGYTHNIYASSFFIFVTMLSISLLYNNLMNKNTIVDV